MCAASGTVSGLAGAVANITNSTFTGNTSTNSNSSDGGNVVNTGSGINPTLTAGDTDVWSGIFRVQRNFWP